MDDKILSFCKNNCDGTPAMKSPESSVRYGNTYRIDKAISEIKKAPVPVDTIISYVNEFYKELGMKPCDSPKYDNPIINDDFYKKIKEKYDLKNKNDIIWMIFTKDGYLGLVALSNDINFDIARSKDECLIKDKANKKYHTTKGIIMYKIKKTWDKSFVLVFPIKDIPEGLTRHDIERGVGNYLISKNVPIIDYYSHNF